MQMKILYYDCFCGISGDMNLGALLDLGVDEAFLRKELSKLSLDDEFEMTVHKAEKKGITGIKVDIDLKDDGHHHHHHRKLKDIEELIGSSGLSDSVKASALNMFTKIARAEAKVHGKTLYEVHFHEVGAVDSLVDITGAAIALDYLKVDKVIASSVQVGGGFVNCAHGMLPVPAPATAELLSGIPVKTGLVPHETTTPTGAAILAANADAFTDDVSFSITRTGYGLGTRDFEIPNVLRVYLAEETNGPKTEKQVLLETNIDDMSPEWIGFAEERLFQAGALDVYKTPIMMKKGRSALQLSILTDEEHEADIENVLFTETTTIGLRKFKVDKIMLEREYESIQTKYGSVKVKKAYFKGRLVNAKPEYDDIKEMAERNGVPISGVYREIQKEMEKDGKRL
jgi:uncharacterized protein (TIGR00299 family) protein